MGSSQETDCMTFTPLSEGELLLLNSFVWLAYTLFWRAGKHGREGGTGGGRKKKKREGKTLLLLSTNLLLALSDPFFYLGSRHLLSLGSSRLTTLKF